MEEKIRIKLTIWLRPELVQRMDGCLSGAWN